LDHQLLDQKKRNGTSQFKPKSSKAKWRYDFFKKRLFPMIISKYYCSTMVPMLKFKCIPIDIMKNLISVQVQQPIIIMLGKPIGNPDQA